MFALVRTGGKQYRVAAGDRIAVERLPGVAGVLVELTDVLMVSDGAGATIGAPLVAGASVAATVLEQKRADKVLIFKKKRRHNYRRKRGHRQYLTVLQVTEILTDGRRPQAVAPAVTTPEETGEKMPPAKKAAPKKAAAKPVASKRAAKKPAPKKPGKKS